MPLVRVYCGLASADSADRPAVAGTTLISAVVDDAGRLLHVCEISDDPLGYARLGALLVERSGSPSGTAIAADSDDHTVTSLMSAAGRPLAIADDDSVDDFAERFADDESLEEIQSPPAQRRAVGLARALQAGALSAVTLPAPRDLAAYKPILAAHTALATGRHSAAVALREVLRELYPAALRAYSDPAEPLALAVLDAIPEPGMLSGANGQPPVATDAIVAHLVADGIAHADVVGNAVTALRLAVAETPRRATINRALTATVAETVRQAVAAVRACDAGCDALVSTLTARLADIGGPSKAPSLHHRAPRLEPSGSRRGRPEPASGGLTTAPKPLGAPPVAPTPVTSPSRASSPVIPAAAVTRPVSTPPLRETDVGDAPARHGETPAGRPVSAPPSAGSAPTQTRRNKIPPAEAGEPFRPTLTTAAINSARAERKRPTAIPPRPKTSTESRQGGFSATDLSVPVPATRPEQENAPPGSRANWPLVPPTDDEADAARSESTRRIDGPTGEGRVTPPWLADDLPPEPPVLRLVEPQPAKRALLEDTDPHLQAPPLRLVDQEENTRQTRAERPPVEPLSSPVADDGDGDLLIFAAARSAWFTGHGESDWSSSADSGWRAAEQAARPAVGEETNAGLPKRVPRANLVPGSPLRDERQLRIVRDPASLAENTTGYFRGWRRGQEIGGFAVGGRPGRESAGGWDFSRDNDERDDDQEYAYRSAGYHS